MSIVSRPIETKTYLISLGVVAALAVGFADLIRGGTTISALVLTIAYAVLVPLAIWRDGGRIAERPANGRAEVFRPSYLVAAVVGIAVFALYAVTLAPSTAMWDTSEYIAAAYTFGIPHPPGNPFFVLIGRFFSLIPVATTVAARINVLAALSSAAAAAMWFLVTERVVTSWLPHRWQRVIAGVLGAVLGATAFTVWNQSVVNEKVYTVSLVGIAVIAWLTVRWSDEPDGRKADRTLVLIAYLLGLGYGNHMAGMLPAPAVALAVLIVRPRTVLRWRLLLACAGVLLLGLTPFATQPIRAAYFPPINEGEPTACRTELKASCTFSKGTLDAFLYNFNRGQYGKPDLSDRQAPFTDQVGMWWMYFKWQWLRDADQQRPLAQSLLAAVFLVLGLFGGWVHFQRDRRSFWFFGALMGTMTLVLIYYLNFKLGASQDPEQPVPHEVRDRDYFFLWSFSAWGVWAALGLLFIWESVAALVGADTVKETVKERGASMAVTHTVTRPTRRSWLLASPVLALALVPLMGNAHWAPRSGEHDTRDFAADLLNSVEPYGVLVTVGDNDTFPLWYAQEVEGIRRDVVVANTSLLNTDWYVRQLIRRPVQAYDAAKGPAVYRNHAWVKPAAPPLKMTLDEADSVPQYYQLSGPMVFKAGAIQTTIDPHRLQYGVLQRADALVLRMIQDGANERPIYFARSSGPYARELGLENRVLIQGLASKVFVSPSDSASAKDTVFVQGDGWLDVTRTAALWHDVFAGPRSVIAKGDWVDRPSVSIPYIYILTGMELAEVFRNRGQSAEARSAFDTAKQVARATRLDAMIENAESAFAPPAGATAAGDTARGAPLRIDQSAAPTTRSSEPTVPKRGRP
jgi:hypothetical protein